MRNIGNSYPCKSCNKLFLLAYPGAFYCGPVCREESKRTSRIKVNKKYYLTRRTFKARRTFKGAFANCKVCQKEFWKNHHRQVCCGDSCQVLRIKESQKLSNIRYQQSELIKQRRKVYYQKNRETLKSKRQERWRKFKK